MAAPRAPLAAALALLTHTAAAQTLPAIIHPTGARGAQATAHREGNGRYFFETAVNGVALPMIFDTGASHIVLRAEDAARVGVDMAGLRYASVANTANGKTEVAPVMIETFSVGAITRRNVQALVAKPGTLTLNLLGQSLLSRLAGYRLEGETLILQGE